MNSTITDYNYNKTNNVHLILFEGIYMHNLLHLKKHILLSMQLKLFSPLNVQNVKLLRHGFASIVFGNTETNVWAKFSLLIIQITG